MNREPWVVRSERYAVSGTQAQAAKVEGVVRAMCVDVCVCRRAEERKSGGGGDGSGRGEEGEEGGLYV